MALTHLTATLDCTGGWYSAQEWHGVLVGHLLDLAQPTATARTVVFASSTGYSRRYSLAEARQLLLATHVGGNLLSHGHGSPARLVAPGHRGYDWVKWVARINVVESPWFWQPPLPL
jgi:DMSO/TMAO reductase YedYZ molybdopterin-dependent catalytic subunit